MLGWQLYLVLSAQTTIEFYSNRFKDKDAKTKGEAWTNEYDLGTRKNFQLFFGTVGRHWITSVFPTTKPSPGDGVTYFTRTQSTQVIGNAHFV